MILAVNIDMGDPVPPGGGPDRGSWANITESHIRRPARSNKNALEILLETERNCKTLTESMVGDLLTKLSIEISDIIIMQLGPAQ